MFRPASLLAVGCTLWLAAISARAATPEPAPAPLRDQLAAAQAAEDRASVIEICRRMLAEPPQGKLRTGIDTATLLETLFRAQLAERDFARAHETLNRMEQSGARLPGVVFELRGDLLLASSTLAVDTQDEATAAWRTALGASGADAASILGKLGDLADSRGDWPTAADWFAQFLKKRPNHVARRARLAVCLLNLGRFEEADKEIRAASAKDATDNTVKAALPLFDRLRAEAATLRALGTKISSAPNDRARFTPLLERAHLLFVARALPAALADADRALAALPDSRAAALLKSQCLWQLNRKDEAGRLGVSKMPLTGWLADRAKLVRVGNFDLTLAANNPPGTDPAKLAATHAGRAVALLDADQPSFALPDAAAAAKLNPRSVEATFVHAAALLRCNRMTEALAEARRATEVDPQSPDAWAILGRLEQEARADFQAAVADLTRALSVREEPRWLQRREHCLRAIGRTAEADKDARRLRELQSSRPAPAATNS